MPDDPYLWWKDGVIYHVYLRSFADNDGDGLGDIAGLIARLDHLNGGDDSLGVDAIWISPCFPSPDRDFGYDVADYVGIDARYGTLADFDRLVAEAHARGIHLLLDLVFNHSSDQHPWFLESRASRENPRRDWYVWRDPKPGRLGRRPPNNWQSVFGGRAWTWDPVTEQDYYHLFLREQPDLNWHNPEVRQALMDAARFWLERGVDGFRLDVFNAWFEHPDYPDNPPRLGLRGFDRQHHAFDISQPPMMESLAAFRSLLDGYSERTSVGEPFGCDPARASSYCGDDRLHMVFNFEFSDARWDPRAFLRAVQCWEQALSDDAWPCYVLSNHDIRRHVTRYGGRHPDAVAKVAAALLLTLRGTPFLYYGEEIALPDAPLRREHIVDPPGRRYWPLYRGRDPNRAPMPWDASPHGGFTTGEPWIPLHPGFPGRNIAAQRQDPHSVLSFYRDLLRLRRRSPALRRGAFHVLTPAPRRGLAFLRSTSQDAALVALNLRPRPLRLTLDLPPPHASWDRVLSSLSHSTARLAAGEVMLGPLEAAIFFAG
jgi:alpha-glucosidase